MTETNDILHRILERPEGEWEAAIADQCAQHPELAVQLRSRFDILRESGFSGGPGDVPLPQRLGEFTLVRMLGEGGMGVVYEARQERLQRSVALKLVRPEHLFFPGARERFRREIEAVARLSHPGIVSVFTVGEADGMPFFAMELVHGASLDDVLKDLAGRPPAGLTGADLREVVARHAQLATEAVSDALFHGDWQAVCLAIGRRLAEALAHAHARGVVHRDVKPSNVLITPEGRVVLLDFGLALPRGADRMTREGSEVGSVPYMAPEQLHGSAGDARTDIYSLGVTLRELLAFRQPFLAPDRELTRRRILAGDGVPLQQHNVAVSWELATVLAAATDLLAKNRYQTAVDFAADLANVQARRPIAARPAGTSRRLWRWAQRRPALATALALGLLTVTGTPTAIAIGIAQQRDRARAAEAAEQDKSYQANLAAANAALQVHDAITARTRLAACPPDQRGFEWHHLSLALDGSLAVLHGHASAVTAVAMTADAALVASGAKDGEVLLWDARTCALRHRLRHHGARIRSMVFAADGSRLWIVDWTQHASVVDVPSGSVLADRPAHRAVERVWLGVEGRCVLASEGGWHFLALDPLTLQPQREIMLQQLGLAPHELLATDGKCLCACDRDDLEIWDLESGRRTCRVERLDGAVHAIRLSSDGRNVALSTGIGRISVHRTADGGLVQGFFDELGSVGTTVQPGEELCFDPRGELLAAIAADGALRVFEVVSGTLLSVRPGHEGRTNAVAFGGPGMLVATAGEDHQVRLWSPFCSHDDRLLEGHAGAIRALGVVDAGARLVSVSEDGCMRTWDVPGGMPLGTLPDYPHHAVSLAITSDGSRAFSSYHGVVLTTDLARFAHVDHWNTGTPVIMCLAAGAGGTLLATTDMGTALLLEPGQRRIRRELHGHETTPPKSVVWTCAVTPDGQLGFTGGEDGLLLQWDLQNEVPPAVVAAGPFGVRALVLVGGGRTLAVARAAVVANGAPADAGEVSCLSPDGRVSWQHPCSSPPLSIAVLPDGSRIVTGHLDGTLTFWNAVNGAPVLVRRFTSAAIRALTVEPGGRWLAAGDTAGHIHLIAADRPLPPVPASASAAAAVAMHIHSSLRVGLMTRDELLKMLASRSDLAPDVGPLIGACERCAPLMTWPALSGALGQCSRPGLPRESHAEACRAAESFATLNPRHGLCRSVELLAHVRLGESEQALQAAGLLQQCGDWESFEHVLRAGKSLAYLQLGRRDEALRELARLRELAASDDPDPLAVSLWREVEAAVR